MENVKHNWVKNPTSKQTLIAFSAWLIGAAMIIISVTNLFTESLFNRRYTVLLLLLLASTATMISVGANYFKNRAKGADSPNIY
jgi:hypothetical protein